MKQYNKYHASPTTKNGMNFDSKLEAARYQDLLLLERSGAISQLETHPRFCIVPAFTYQGKRIRASYYEADFAYYVEGLFVVEDVKGPIETALFRLKWKLMKSLHLHWDFRIYRKGGAE